MTAIRTIISGGERWFSEEDMRKAMKDTQLVTDAAAMLKVSHEKRDDPIECVRKAIAYFYTEATGVLEPASPCLPESAEIEVPPEMRKG